jgi:hypothetical protein
MVLDIDESLGQDEIAAVLEHQRGRIALSKRRALKSWFIFVLLVGTSSLFLAGMPLHSLWDRLGKYLLFLTFVGMLGALVSVLSLWGACAVHREFIRTYSTKEN